MHILAIETSCDETAASIILWQNARATVLANTVASQASLHAQWGGVVPDLASREHIKNIVPVITETLTRANIKPSDIDLIAVTQGPGLMPALLVGVSAAKTLALTWRKPLIGIQHIEGHIYANFVSESQKSKFKNQNFEYIFPLVALVVSGGHTQLVLMRQHFDYTLLGETQDDAAGEAFDKVAKMLGLSYPGGPEIAKRADTYRQSYNGISRQAPDDQVIHFPRPMMNSDDFHFSFSGLKTAVLYFLKKHPEKITDESFVNHVCYEFQEAVVDVLVHKTAQALKHCAPRTLVVAGGVSANTELRNRLRNLINEHFPDVTFLTPEFTYSLDNAAMIGAAAGFRYAQMDDKEKQTLHQTHLTLNPDANLPLSNLRT